MALEKISSIARLVTIQMFVFSLMVCHSGHSEIERMDLSGRDTDSNK